MMRYVHTNIIAKDSKALIEFYKNVFECKSIGEKRDLHGEWLDRLTGIKDAHIIGEHLCLPGYGEDHPTLEIFSYSDMIENQNKNVNCCGIAHIAFEVNDVKKTLEKVLKAGGGQVGELISTVYPNGEKAIFVYATDIEGNIIELQSWN
ncbi:MAG: VOC family protein [Clostridia bacterium]|nr:VOC family protein [Clostridia bacterium]MCI2014366.1 VOC family protein [Clostridia bacterium]